MSNYFKIILLSLLYAITSTNLSIAQHNPFLLTSPNGKINVTLLLKADSGSTTNGLYYTVSYASEGKTIAALLVSRLGLVRTDEDFSTNLNFSKVLRTGSISADYEMVHGKRKHCHNKGNEKAFRFLNANNKPIDVIFRAYDNGVTFGYSFPEASGKECFLTREVTQFNFPNNSNRWMQSYTSSYEDFYNFSTKGKDSKKKQEFGFPALLKHPSAELYSLVSEADVSSQNCATHLANKANPNNYDIVLPEKQMPITLPWQSQWRVIMLGQLHDIVESTLITDVSAPSKLPDTKWIQPGSCAWIYWAYNHGSKDYQLVKKYIDFGAAMGWPYVLIDWEWDVMKNGGTIADAINYAKQKGLKPMLWYNSGDSGYSGPWARLSTPAARAKEFAWLNKMGVVGIKADFFDGDQQKVMKYYLDLLQDAANYHIMVNFHGATIPKGWSRTFPNLMSTEAVYGAEWYNNGPTLTEAAGKHNTTLPFTRNVIGPMDYTPVTFSNSQHPHSTSYAHELALAVVFESGLQHFADKPEAYNALPDAPKNFLKVVPAAWDDTKLLDGYPGEKVIIARKKGDTWYVGGLNGKNTQESFPVSLRFLDSKAYSVEIISDGKNDKDFSVQHTSVKKDKALRIDCLPKGGFIAVLTPVAKASPKKGAAN